MVWCQQIITWNIVDLSSVRSSDINLWVISQEIPPDFNHWSYIFLALTHRYVVVVFQPLQRWIPNPTLHAIQVCVARRGQTTYQHCYTTSCCHGEWRDRHFWFDQLIVPVPVQQQTHWGRDEMATISQTTFSNAFSWMKIYEFCWRFHWNLFLRFELTIFQRCFG